MEKKSKCKIKFLLFLLFLFTPFFLNATAQEEKRISLDFTNAPMSLVLNEIGKQASLRIIYNTKDVNPEKIISVKVHEKELGSVMADLLRNSNAAYMLKDDCLVLFSSKEKKITESVKQQDKRTVKGLITDETGEPLIGVSVKIKGTTTGTITDLDGNYVLDITDDKAILEFSYIGYKTVTLPLTGASSYNVIMKEDSQQLGEVVITAMGIERKAESLTYATQKVGGKELTRAKDVNFINSLQGKSAGLTITPNSSGAGGGSSKITLRGQSSILGNNQPLIVLDGIPMSSGMSSQAGGEALMSGGSRDGGDLLSTINPDDIANISILKGPNAAALYGSAANNGVIIITTKGGREGKIRIDVSSNTTFETPLMYPKQQKDFAPEIIGSEVKYNGWGNPISEITDDQLAMFPYLTRNPRNNVTDFFDLGQTYNNSVALSGGTEYSSTYFSYGNTTQKGLIGNNKFVRHNLLFKQSYNLYEGKLKLDFSLNYIAQNTKNRPVIGKAKGVLPGIYSTPSAVDLRYFDKNRTHIATAEDAITKLPGATNLIGQHVQTFPWTENIYMNNPYFMLDAIYDEAIRDRIMASFSAKYQLFKGLSAQARVSVDKVLNDGTTTEDVSIKGANYLSTNAVYWASKSSHREIYSDYLLTYDTKVDDISINATAGTSFKRIKDRSSHMTKTTDSTYVYPNIAWPVPGVGLSQDPLSAGGRVGLSDGGFQTNWEAAIFATVQIGFWDKGYIDASFRNDWAKAFQQFAKGNKNKSFPYYSIGGNLLLKELFPLSMPKVNALKLRASYSVVGNSVPNEFYQAQTINPLNGNVGAREAAFDNPKPETTKAIELGLDGILFDNKVDFDLTVYQAVMENQFLRITTASGQSKPANSGKVRNRGVEFTANYHANFPNKNFRWSTGVNLSYNDNKILETYRAKDGSDYEVTMNASGINMRTKFIKGGSYGDLYGTNFNYGSDGKIILQDGAPQFSGEYDRYLGNTTAKFNFGWNNTFSYKDFSLYMLIDGKVGGKVLSITEAEMDMAGLSERSAEARLANGGMVTLPDGQQVTARKYYEAVGGQKYDCIYDASNVRIREISLGYTFRDLLGASKSLTISLIARNLGFIYKNSPVDPDISATAGNTFGGIEAYSLPTTRSFGLNIKFSL